MIQTHACEQPRIHARGWFFRSLRQVRRRWRFAASALVFLALAVAALICGLHPALAVLLAFGVATLIFLVTAVLMFATSRAGTMRRRARAQDEGY